MPNRPGQASAVEAAFIILIILLGLFLLLKLAPGFFNSMGVEVSNVELSSLAKSLLNEILSSPGNPLNWGLNASGLTAFGLAQPNNPYSLDPYKVLQLIYWDFAHNVSSALSPSNLQGYCSISQISGQGFIQYLTTQYNISYVALTNGWLFTIGAPTNWTISYNYVKQLLGLGDKYDFLLVINPVFNVTISKPYNCGQYVCINVSVYQFNAGPSSPVPGAKVTLNYFAASLNVSSSSSTSKASPNPKSSSSSSAVSTASQAFYNGTLINYTNSMGIAVFNLGIVGNASSYYIYAIAYAEVGGLGDYAYAQYPASQTPLLMAGLLPTIFNTGGTIVFAHPHLFTNCLYSQGLISNSGQSALGIRIFAVYKSIYGYVLSTVLNVTLTNPGRGSQSYPIPCTQLSASNSVNESACYINLPYEPMLLIIYVTRNSNGQSGNVPISQVLIIPYGYYPEYYLYDRVIVFGRAVKYAPVGVAEALAYIGNAAYEVHLYLYYRGNVYAGLGSG